MEKRTFIHVRTEGELLPVDILARILSLDKDMEGLKPEDYSLAPSEKINEAINRSWQRMTGLWRHFVKERAELAEGETGTAKTRSGWLLPLFDELDFGRVQPATSADRTVTLDDGRTASYSISHMAGNAPLHLIGCNIGLDKREKGTKGAAQASPHSMVQEFLNRSDAHLWGVVSNGRALRILRDNASLSRQAYIEFDLEGMFTDEAFSDFALLWLVCHRSRFDGKTPEACRLEVWAKSAQQTAIEALDSLSKNVERAIETLGQGFLESHNAALVEKLRTGALSQEDYLHQLLRLVYRMIFCFVIEDRALLHAPGTPKAARTRYDRYFSTRRLRELARTLPGSRHGDAWESFKLLMRFFGSPDGCADLGITPMGSFLWSDEAIPDLMRARLNNEHFFQAIRELAYDHTQSTRRHRPVNFRHLGARELGSVYESLLELHGSFEGNVFKLFRVSGNERKKTGAYYTPTELIESLLDSALEPVARATHTADNPELALLGLKVCDPACGSGHFLIAAAHRLAHHLAEIRTGDGEPSPTAMNTALRDVIGRCLYGVDINPMSVELCKVSLWMEAMEPGKPLAFLDHHVVCGNSLFGTTPELIQSGLPDKAFVALEGDDKKAVSALKKANKQTRGLKEKKLIEAEYAIGVRAILDASSPRTFDTKPPDSLAGVEAQEAAYRDWKQSDEYRAKKTLADLWCAAFVMPRYFRESERFPGVLTDQTIGITQKDIIAFARKQSVDPQLVGIAETMAHSYQFLHWDVAFPEVAARGGFDVILANPPWERIKIQEKEWFAVSRPDIANAPNAAARGALIKALRKENPALFDAYMEAQREVEGFSHFLRDSGRYPLCGVGDINLYAVFAENMRNAVNPSGRVGCIVPSGIATDDTTKAFFREITSKKALVSLYDFENQGIFPGIDNRIKFSLITMGSGKRPSTMPPVCENPEYVFFAHTMADLHDKEKQVHLSAEDLAQINPNTMTSPIFRSRKDAELTKAVYRRVPVLIREAVRDANDNVLEEEQNPWGVKFGTMFHMSNDSALFRTREQLEAADGVLTGNRFTISQGCTLQTDTGPLEIKEGEWLPLYEAKMVHHYNHRWATYDGMEVRNTTQAELNDPDFCVQPRYWVSEAYVREKMAAMKWEKLWLMGWRKITNNTNERTVVGGIFPVSSVGDSLPLWLPNCKFGEYIQSCLSSYCCDFITRFKIGGVNLNFFIAEQLAVLPPEAFSTPVPCLGNIPACDFLLPRILELTYTTEDMRPFAQDLGYDGEPFVWDEERRFHLRVEIDALFFHLYLPSNPDGTWKRWENETAAQYAALTDAFATPRAAVDYIMDTFTTKAKNDIRTYGTYRTKTAILKEYDAMQEAIQRIMHDGYNGRTDKT